MWLEHLHRDLLFAARRLLRAPAFTIAAILTLALAIGANASIFTIVHRVVLNPLPYDEPGKIVVLWEVNPDGIVDRVSVPTFEDWKADLRTLASVAAYRRADFTFAYLMPRTTSKWDSPVQEGARTGQAHFTDAMIAARQRVTHALDAVGPEFSGLLVDVCCFLKKLDDLERERSWPARSAKVVLQLGLDRLARHYGLDAQASGRARAAVRTWLAEDVAFTVEVGSGGR